MLNYQAVARNAVGVIIPNQNVGLRFTIHDGSANGAIVYSETNSDTTNQFGLFATEVGGGTPVTGIFSDIFGGGGYKYLQVEMDPAGGTNYADMGVSQLLSVPYAFYSKSSADWGLDGQNMFNLNSGNLGIGTTLPSSQLHVVSLNDTALYSETLSSSPLTPAIQGYANSSANNNQIGVLGSYYPQGSSYGAGIVGIGYAGSMPPANKDIGVYGSAGGSGLAVYAKGKVQVDDGTQGNMKILTSDPNGIASWSSARAIQDTVNPVARTFFKAHYGVGGSVLTYDNTALPAYHDTFPTPFNIIDANNAGAYHTATASYVIPETGYYHFEARILYWVINDQGSQGGCTLSHELSFKKNGVTVSGDLDYFFELPNSNYAYCHYSAVYTGYFLQGDAVSVYGNLMFNGRVFGGTTSNIQVSVTGGGEGDTYFTGWKLW